MIRKTYLVLGEDREQLTAIEVLNGKNMRMEYTAYDRDGACIENTRTSYTVDNRIEEILMLDPDGNLIQRMQYIYETTDDGRIERELTHFQDGTFDEIVSHYDGSNRITKVEYFQDSVPVRNEVYEYDEAGRIRESREYDENGIETTKEVYTHSDNSRKISSFENGELAGQVVMTFDEKGNLIRQDMDTGAHLQKHEYTYGENNKLTGATVFEEDVLLQREIRKYDERNNCILIEIERFNSARKSQVDKSVTEYEYDDQDRLVFEFGTNGIYRYTHEDGNQE